MFGTSDVIEGVGDLTSGITCQGLDQRSYNPVRDTVFGGNEFLYAGAEVAVSLGTSAAASKALASTSSATTESLRAASGRELAIEAEVAVKSISKVETIISEVEVAQANIVTKNGIRIEGFTRHGIHRSIGNGFDRIGVRSEGIYDALTNPLKIKEPKTDIYGRISQRFLGKEAEVVVNPETGKIISVNPISSSKLARLLKEWEIN